jgi:hypothetical protein
VKKYFPHHAVIASLMVETKEEWQQIVKDVENAGADGIELNFGCPHGMCERGMGSAVGQEPEICKLITSWVKEVAKIPVIVKLTPNISDITEPAEAAARGGADAISLINTIQSLTGVDIRPVCALSDCGRQKHERRLLRPGRETHRPEYGEKLRPTPRGQYPHFWHRRHRKLARRDGIPAAWRQQRAGVYGGDALRFRHHPRDDSPD